MNRQPFIRSLRIHLSQISLFLFGHFFLFGPGAARTQYLAPDALLLSSFALSLYYWSTHNTHCRSPHNTHSCSPHNTLSFAAASPPPFRLRSLVSLNHPHCPCLSKPQLCRTEAGRKRLCGFQRCKELPTRYNILPFLPRR